jgi:hypothetical protein
MARPDGDAAPVLCEAPRPRWHAVRTAAGVVMGIARTVTN